MSDLKQTAMDPSFVVYIDESGDEGFKFDTDNRSSEWFVLSAVVVRAANDRTLVELMAQIRLDLRRSQNYTIHFRDLSHAQKVPVVHRIATAPIRTVSVICNKTLMTETEYLRGKHSLYRYLVKFLLERVSWLCRERHNSGTSKLARIIFSNRTGMSYDDIRSYLQLLQTTQPEVQIDWDHISPDELISLPHSKRAGLQIVDAVASSYWSAFEPTIYGYAEHSYAKTLAKIACRHEDRMLGYGVKLWPREAVELLRLDSNYAWIRGLTQQKRAGPRPEDPAQE